MFVKLLQRLLGNNNAKEIKKMRAIADHINEIEPNYVKLSDANLVAKPMSLNVVCKRGNVRRHFTRSICRSS